MRDQVQRGKLLEDAHRVRRAEHRDGAREPDISSARRSSSQKHDGRRIQKLRAVMFANAENIQAHMVGKLDLLQQMLHAIHWTQREPRSRVRDSRCKTVNADLHLCRS